MKYIVKGDSAENIIKITSNEPITATKIDVIIGSLTKTYENPVLPLFVSLTSEDTNKLSTVYPNSIFISIYKNIDEVEQKKTYAVCQDVVCCSKPSCNSEEKETLDIVIKECEISVTLNILEVADISSINARLEALESFDIATGQSIINNATAISKNNDNITANRREIESNDDEIDTNKNDIGELGEQVQNNQNRISALEA